MHGWIPANDAIGKLQGGVGGRLAAKLLLADALRDGLLGARAAFSWEAEGGLHSWKGPENSEHEFRIRRAYWKATDRWLEDQSSWRWRKGNFFVTLDSTAQKRRYFKHVEFREDQLAVLARNSGITMKGKGSGGRSKNLGDWRCFWFYLMQIAKDDKLDTDTFKNKNDLLKQAHLKSGTKLSRNTLDSEAAAVWKRFIHGDPGHL